MAFQLKSLLLGGLLSLVVVAFLYYFCVSGFRTSPHQSVAAMATGDRTNFYTAWALRDFQPGGEMVYSDAPRPEVASEVAGAFYEGARVTHVDAEQLNSMSNVYVIALEECDVSRDFWETLSWSGIRYLFIDGSNVDDRDCRYIANASDLQYISIHRTNVTKAGVASMTSQNPSVKINNWYR